MMNLKSSLILTFLFFTISAWAIAVPNPISETEPDPYPIDFDEDSLTKRDFEGQPGIIGPFSLITGSSYKPYDNLILNGRHIGAGTNLAVAGSGLPLRNSTYNVFYLNTTKGEFGPQSGTILYPMYGPGVPPIGAGLVSNGTGDVSQLWFYPVENWAFSFDHAGRFGYNKTYNRWLLCDKLLTPYGPLTGVAYWTGCGQPNNNLCKSIVIKKGGFAK